MRRVIPGLVAALLVVALLSLPAMAQDATSGLAAWLPVVHLAPVNPSISGGQGIDAYPGPILVPQRRSGSFFDPFALRYSTAYPADDQGDMAFQLLFQMPPVRPTNYATIEGIPGDGVAADLAQEAAIGCSPDDSSYCDAPVVQNGTSLDREAFFGLTVGDQPAVVEHLPNGGNGEVWDVIWDSADAQTTFRLKLQGAPAGLLNAAGLSSDNVAQAQQLAGIAQGLLPLDLSATPTPLPAAATPAVSLPALTPAPATPAPAPTTPPPPAPVAPGASSAVVGSRARPVPLGLTFPTGDGWQIAVQSIQPDAWKSIQDFNSFNNPPRADFQYFMASVTVSREAPGTASFLTGRLNAIGNAGIAYSAGGTNTCGQIPNPLKDADIPSGGFATGNVCWQIATKDASSLVMYYESLDSSFNPFRVYYALR